MKQKETEVVKVKWFLIYVSSISMDFLGVVSRRSLHPVLSVSQGTVHPTVTRNPEPRPGEIQPALGAT